MSDKVINQRDVLSTKDYDQFKILEGNREINVSNVKSLQKLMLNNGNLTYEFPVIVDKDMYVIDGQHRIEALKGLGWEVGYTIEGAATIDTVRAINQGGRNWSWRDVAHSYAARGDEHYKWFLSFADMYELPFSPTLLIATGGKGENSNRAAFKRGSFKVYDKAKAHDTAKQVTEIQRLVQLKGGDFTFALIMAMQSPAYNHERMMHKLRSEGERLPGKAKRSDYLRALEDMFNFGYPEDNRVRLF